MKKLCIFDLDGTIVYTIEDIAAALNCGLTECGYPTLRIPEVAAIVGYSTNYMFEHAVPDAQSDDWQRVGRVYQAYYARHCCDHSTPYEGILKNLTKLKNAGVRMAVISNKPHPDTLTVVETLFPRDLFNIVLGRMDKFATKPAPDALRFVMEHLGVSPADALYVGDSEVDVRFAQNAGIPCLSVSWGYRTRQELIDAGATHIIDDADEIAGVVLSE